MIAKRLPDSSTNYLLGWFQPWTNTKWSGNNNRGANNAYYHPLSDGSPARVAGLVVVCAVALDSGYP